MNNFADLFRLFPTKVMDLLVDECCVERRPVYLMDTLDDLNQSCEWCDKQALYEFEEYDDKHFDPPLPNMCRDSTCGGARCRMVDEYFWYRSRGPVDKVAQRQRTQRRRRLEELHGKEIWREPKETRLLKALVMMLYGETRRVVNCEKHTAPQAA